MPRVAKYSIGDFVQTVDDIPENIFRGKIVQIGDEESKAVLPVGWMKIQAIDGAAFVNSSPKLVKRWKPPKKRGRKTKFQVGDVVKIENQSDELVIVNANEDGSFDVGEAGGVVIGGGVSSDSMTLVKRPKPEKPEGKRRGRKPKAFEAGDEVEFDIDSSMARELGFEPTDDALYTLRGKIQDFFEAEVVEGEPQQVHVNVVVDTSSDGVTESIGFAIPVRDLRRPKAHRKPKDESNPQEVWITPQPLAKKIVEMAKASCPNPAVILEPSAGNGAFVRELRAAFPEAVIVAVEPREDMKTALEEAGANAVFSMTFEDFCAVDEAGEILGSVDLIVMNPPFTLAESHVSTLREFLSPDGRNFALLRLGFLCGPRCYPRRDGSSDGTDVPFWDTEWNYVFSVTPVGQRPGFIPEKPSKTDGQEYAVFEFGAALNSNVDLNETALPVMRKPFLWKEK